MADLLEQTLVAEAAEPPEHRAFGWEVDGSNRQPIPPRMTQKIAFMISRSGHLRGLQVFAATGIIGAIKFHSRSARSVGWTMAAHPASPLAACAWMTRSRRRSLAWLAFAAAQEAASRAAGQRDQVCEILGRDLEAARYAADRAFRQYDAADPANRLVAGELEARWKRALAKVWEIESRIAAHDTTLPAASLDPAMCHLAFK